MFSLYNILWLLFSATLWLVLDTFIPTAFYNFSGLYKIGADFSKSLADFKGLIGPKFGDFKGEASKNLEEFANGLFISLST